jgi:RNA polymerase-binding transcription factor DksA
MANKIKPIRYSDEELREFKTLINKRIFHSKIILKYHLDEYDKSSDDLETFSQIAMQRYTISELKEALERIQTRRFGVCEKTRQLIDKKTLLLLPYVRTIEDGELLLGK